MKKIIAAITLSFGIMHAEEAIEKNEKLVNDEKIVLLKKYAQAEKMTVDLKASWLKKNTRAIKILSYGISSILISVMLGSYESTTGAYTIWPATLFCLGAVTLVYATKHLADEESKNTYNQFKNAQQTKHYFLERLKKKIDTDEALEQNFADAYKKHKKNLRDRLNQKFSEKI